MANTVTNECFQTMLRPYSKIVLILDSILRWDASYYPAIIAGLVSIFHVLLCFTDMSTVSYFCVLGIALTIIDFALPIVNDVLAKDWSTAEESQYKIVCGRYSSAANDIISFFLRFSQLRRVNIKLYYVILLSLLLTLTWIGTWVSDVFFLYVVTLFITLYPGLCRQEFFQKYVCDKFNTLTAYLLPRTNAKVEKKDK